MPKADPELAGQRLLRTTRRKEASSSKPYVSPCGRVYHYDPAKLSQLAAGARLPARTGNEQALVSPDGHTRLLRVKQNGKWGCAKPAKAETPGGSWLSVGIYLDAVEL